MANVFDVANFFIQLSNQSEDDLLSNLKLNKLLYYAQGAFLARTGKPLFENRIEAWPFGPVVPEVYQKYKAYGKNPIFSGQDNFDESVFTSDELNVLCDVMREFGQYTGSKLVTLTHQPGTPWSDATANKERVINQSAIRDYFLRHPVPSFEDLLNTLNIPVVDTLPAEWYDPDEDAEWESYKRTPNYYMSTRRRPDEAQGLNKKTRSRRI